MNNINTKKFSHQRKNVANVSMEKLNAAVITVWILSMQCCIDELVNKWNQKRIL